MCYQAAGPKGSDIRGDGRLSLAVVKRVIEEAADLEELVGSRVHVSGGEAFINYREMIEIFSHARYCGFHDIGATTNAFWAISRNDAERKCTELASAGVTYLEVSTDYWHLPYIDPKRVRNLTWAARQTGVRIMLRTLTSRDHHMPELLAEFTDEELLYVQIGNSTVAPVGRGKYSLDPATVYGSVAACVL